MAQAVCAPRSVQNMKRRIKATGFMARLENLELKTSFLAVAGNMGSSR
jgi:hypothetical protein